MLLTLSLLLDFAFLVFIPLYLLHRRIAKKLMYWERHGVYSPPTKPFVGNYLDCVLLKKNTAIWIAEYYQQIEKDFFGIYIFDDKYFVPKSPELIKNILIKDFNYFLDRNVAAPKACPIIAQMLFMQKSPEWRQDRSRLSVAHTSGKLKAMFPLILNSVQDFLKFLRKNQGFNEGKDLAAMYTTDVISKCAFGINSYSFSEKVSDFTKHRRKIFDFSFKNACSQLVYFFKPGWVDKFDLRFMPEETLNYFREAFVTSFNARTGKSSLHDSIDIMKDIQTDDGFKNSSDEIRFCSAALQFFLAGFETSSATISFTFYEFAVNPEVQDRVREEVRTLLNKHNCISYDNLNELQYLEACLKETLRKYPVLPFIDRKCNTDYPVPGTDFVIEKGTPVLIPTYGLHYDNIYWHNPYKYDPERFINNIVNNSNGIHFLPFGDGPRRCIGERFASLTVKLALAYVVANFKIEKSSETPIFIKFEPKSFLLQSTVGLPLIFTEIDNI